MKGLHVLSLSMAMLCATTTNAQKKTWIVEVDGSYDRQIYSAQYAYPQQILENWSLDAAVGKQISKHFTVGVQAGIDEGQSMAFREIMPPVQAPPPYWEAVKYSSLNIKLGLWGRYTYWIDKHFFVYSQLSAGYQNEDSHELSGVYAYYSPVTSAPYSPSAEVPRAGIYSMLFPAIGINIINGYGVHMNIGGVAYSHSQVGDGAAMYDRINVNFGHQFAFGLHKIIGWKKMNNQQDDPNAMLK